LSTESTQPEAPNLIEVLLVPRRELETVLERGGGDEGVWQAKTVFTAHSAGTLGHRPVDR
jgi:hypothetical protein